MRKKKPFLIGMIVGLLARPVVVRAYRPFRNTVQKKLYDIAVEYIERLDADRPS